MVKTINNLDRLSCVHCTKTMEWEFACVSGISCWGVVGMIFKTFFDRFYDLYELEVVKEQILKQAFNINLNYQYKESNNKERKCGEH